MNDTRRMTTTTLSSRFQIVIPKAVREKLHLVPKQRFQVVGKGKIIYLIPEVPLRALKGFIPLG
jgi:AbrB family looped-hinge helix DNA binding protein